MTERTAVYDLIVDGEVYYVGASRDPKTRLAYHRARKKIPRSATLKIVKWYPTRGRALLAESRRIIARAPPGNTVYHPVKDAERYAKSDAERERRKREKARAKAEADIAAYSARWSKMWAEVEELMSKQK